ncbi:hypothetical protein CHLRE_17g724600v5 [Chlamydomonas reinhardtii]|uniref:Rieske domain-containing protein n=1 Tax=Chlamydomonas reinhardtii TaxID=3055 RepID=A0A2K3CQJ1_CHLRE|nr:uncharacterized protein CHLRE_17g724600v5 [Chlamydomonas reinhardtii]XP_042914777.1 uncharacterized protein CHLRE_17g724600v5 [Chlamydomonas reinhardtii]PNW70550.1 hypothetical protein CHLRE_17g724600v5 [Chlamydomonas reinhardtii]PNW70551.1 hypothetical protein CHLRE_17g724600v5 [Chlamydomonas reinhardtii]
MQQLAQRRVVKGAPRSPAVHRATHGALRVTRKPVALAAAATTAATTVVEPVQTDAVAASGEGAVAPAVSPAPASNTFQWHSEWYPVGIIEDLDPRRPHATHLLGIPLALWKDAQGQWRAVEDRCSHRLAPLSEGRVEKDGTLQCAYHGWQFDGRGACTHIPQLRNDEKAQQVACASRRSCVRAYPTQVAHGLLWVLPDSSAAGWEKAGTVPVTAIPELLAPGGSANGRSQFGNWYARDMPVRFDILAENLLDPAHLPFAHHGVMGNRNKEQGSSTTLRTDTMGVAGFVCDAKLNGPEGTVSWQAPSLIKYEFGSLPFITLLYCVPAKPGWSRFYSATVLDANVKSAIPGPAIALVKLISNIRWFDHVTRRHLILDGDTYMLHVQERLLLEKNNDWRGAYYMPAPADGSVVATRRWFDEHGGAVPTCEPGVQLPPQMSKEAVLERYHQHTKNCKDCSQALRNVETATWLAAGGGVLAALVLVARAVAGLPLLAPESVAPALAGAVCGGLVAVLQALRQQFIFVDYVHQDKK